jgi:predicted HTH transcriptional regulator
VATLQVLLDVVPSAEPEPWLRSQLLLRQRRPTVAAVVLFAEEPQAVLPKQCAIKLFRYEGRLDTAFEAMKRLRLREPEFVETESSVVVHLRHEPLASPEEAVMRYLVTHDEITNSVGRRLTGIGSENAMKNVFYRLAERGLLERVPEKAGAASAWRRPTGARRDA